MDEGLRGVALARGGVFTLEHARSVEVGQTQLRVWCRGGEVLRLRRNAYVLGDLWKRATPVQRLALRTRAVLASRGEGVASHQSALSLHGLPLDAVDLETVDILGVVNRTRSASGLRVHPQLAWPPVVADGYRCLPIAQALAQVTVRSGLTAGMVPLDAALHTGRVSPAEVADALEPLCTTPRLIDRRNALLAQSDALCESPGESRTRLLLHSLGYHDVRSQVTIREDDEVVARVDFLLAGRVVVEFDGAVKYEGSQGREALVAEKRREDRLRALGYAVIRLTWVDLAHPERISRAVRRALAQVQSASA